MKRHTCYSLDQVRLLAVDKVDNVPLRGIRISVFKLKDFVYAIVFEGGKLDKETEESS